ncbi:hypothetical protein C2R22_08780 [Salinigranum rubrum]|uniref:DUF5658 domain-containing protein n=1 Tax=Salinigranum rubrum TaxID=755307 RepID=A0A2I8VIJ1_9EURY|nr:hypothetical protein [Salinigranum rubrum]AUV81731.1 hypothetical protein C2R22_08780 [Salinigranum rubrum]
MTVPRTRPRARHEEYWDWLTVALFLLVTVDLLTTLGAAARFGVGTEANPLVASLLSGPLWALVVTNLVAVVAAVGGFAAVLRLLRETSPRLRAGFALTVELWLGLLVAGGLLVFANNLAVVVHGVSLL